MFHVEHRDGAMADGGGDPDGCELSWFPAVCLGCRWFADENPPSGAHQACGPKHGRVRGGEPPAHRSIEATHPVAIVRQCLDIGTHDTRTVMKIERSDGPMNEIRSFFPSIDHRHLHAGAGNGQYEPRNTSASAEINDGPHLVGQCRHKGFGVSDDLGNRAGTEHSDALRLAQQALERGTRKVRGEHASQRRCCDEYSSWLMAGDSRQPCSAFCLQICIGVVGVTTRIAVVCTDGTRCRRNNDATERIITFGMRNDLSDRGKSVVNDLAIG